jgi:hypothetical protein
MSENMVERVARALFEQQKKDWESDPENDLYMSTFEDGCVLYRNEARAAIAAMREPTDMMCRATDVFDIDWNLSSPADAFRAMIDTAILTVPQNAVG